MPNFKVDNPLSHIDLPLAVLCNMGALKGPTDIRPEHAPLLNAVESAEERNFKTGASKTVSRYLLVFPGSNFMRIVVKVDEAQPSITQEAIDKCGGIVRVNIDGFSSGVMEVDGGAARPYFKATRITPVTSQTAQK